MQPEVIAQHLAWSRDANINLWLCSWWGAGTREDITISSVIMRHTDLGDHKIALLYETTGRVRRDEGYNPHRVGPDMEYICNLYFDHENYYRSPDGRPVVVLYLSRLLWWNGTLGDVTEIMRTTARDACGTEIFLLGDQVWNGPPGDNEEYPPFDYLDGVTNYDLYGNMNSPPYAGQEAVDRYYQQQVFWKQRAEKDNVRYIPAISPGYNDR